VDSGLSVASDIGVVWRIAKLRLRGQMAYRSSFAMQIAGNLLANCVEIMATIFLFNKFDNLGGWSLNEVLFLHGISMVAFSLGDTISNGIQTVPTLIRAGEFDRLMIRPVSIFLQAIVNEVSLRHFGLLIQGVIIFTYGALKVDADWTLANVAYLALMIACGAAIFVALFTIEAIISFWTVNSVEAVNAFTYGGSDLAQYPLHIFPKLFQRFFLWVLPLGFVCYYPAVQLLGKDDPIGLPGAVRFLGLPMTIAFCIAVAFGWRAALNRHGSTGS
jgi:ABC-2 type transport system permease protein